MKKNHVSVHVVGTDGQQTHVEVYDDDTVGGQLVTALARVLGAYGPEVRDEVEQATELVHLLDKTGLADFAQALREPAPPTRCTEVHDVAHVTGVSVPARCVENAGHGYGSLLALHHDSYGNRWSTGASVKATLKTKEDSVTADRVTVNPDGSAEVRVNVNGVSRTYVETAVHYPSDFTVNGEFYEQRRPFDLDAYRSASTFHQKLVDLLSCHGWDTRVGVPAKVLADALVRYLETREELVSRHLAEPDGDPEDDVTLDVLEVEQLLDPVLDDDGPTVIDGETKDERNARYDRERDLLGDGMSSTDMLEAPAEFDGDR